MDIPRTTLLKMHRHFSEPTIIGLGLDMSSKADPKETGASAGESYLGPYKIPKLTLPPSDAGKEEHEAATKTAKRRRARARKAANAKEEGHRAPGQLKKGKGKGLTLEFPVDKTKWTTLANFR